MAKRRWVFPKIDWDVEIQTNGIRINSNDLPFMNKTEMVEILRLLGIRAHRGIPHEELIELLQQGESKKIENPIDALRDRIARFIRIHYDRIKDQMLLQCNGNCYQHSDMEVLVCYLASADTISAEETSYDESES